YTCLGCIGAWRALIVPMTLNGSGMRDSSRVLWLSPYTVLRHYAKPPRKWQSQSSQAACTSWNSMNSGHSCAAKKQQRWTWYGFARARRQVLAFINDRRTNAACQKLLKKLDGCQVSRYYSDDWQSYKKCLPAKQPRVGKEGTQHIERHNLNFRPHIKRLQRRTI